MPTPLETAERAVIEAAIDWKHLRVTYGALMTAVGRLEKLRREAAVLVDSAPAAGEVKDG